MEFYVVHYLSTHGASLNTKNEEGTTPLFGAVDIGDIQMVSYLVGRGANVNSQKNDGTTPLMVAVFRCHIDIAKYLLDHHANIALKTSAKGIDALQIAHQQHSTTLVKMLEKVKPVP